MQRITMDIINEAVDKYNSVLDGLVKLCDDLRISIFVPHDMELDESLKSNIKSDTNLDFRTYAIPIHGNYENGTVILVQSEKITGNIRMMHSYINEPIRLKHYPYSTLISTDSKETIELPKIIGKE